MVEVARDVDLEVSANCPQLATSYVALIDCTMQHPFRHSFPGRLPRASRRWTKRASRPRRPYSQALRCVGGLAYGSLPSGSASIHRRCSASAALSTAQASPWHSRYYAMKRTPRRPGHFRVDFWNAGGSGLSGNSGSARVAARSRFSERTGIRRIFARENRRQLALAGP